MWSSVSPAGAVTAVQARARCATVPNSPSRHDPPARAQSGPPPREGLAGQGCARVGPVRYGVSVAVLSRCAYMTFTRASLRNAGSALCLLLSSGVLSFGVLVSTPVAATTSPPRCASTGSVDFGMDLAGSGWRFRAGVSVTLEN